MSLPLTVSLPGSSLPAALGPAPDGVRYVSWNLDCAPPLPHIDIVVPPYIDTLPVLPRLSEVTTRLVQSQSIGYDGVADILPPGHVFANAASVHEGSTAELTVALILAAQRGIPRYVRAADAGEWVSRVDPSLADREVLIVGAGGVGAAIYDRLLPFETRITRVASRARDDERGHIHGIDELAVLLPGAEIVVIGVPLTESTVNLVDDDFLSRMPDGALLVNIARGQVADTAALVAHASAGRIRLALDVTDPEPLPTGHPLFTLPNVLITPHVGGSSTAMMPRMAALVHDQIERMLRGEEARNIVIRS